MSDSLGIPRGRLNDLIIGRKRPTLGEAAALSGRRKATLVSYHDTAGGRHSFYTGRGMSYERFLESESLVDIANEMSDERHYLPFGEVEAMPSQFPKRPVLTRIYHTSRSIRRQYGK